MEPKRENSEALSVMELMVRLHLDNPRQGPGSEEMAKLALRLAKISPEKSYRIADIGCGTGAQTITLAENIQGEIVAVDLFKAFLDKLEERILKKNLKSPIKTMVASMDDLPFKEKELDVIWSEGAVYNMGFKKGVRYWRNFLKTGGILAVSELSWVTSDRPKELEDFWNGEYHEMDTVSGKIKILEDEGYRVLGHFILPDDCWLDNYYYPLLESHKNFLRQFGHLEVARQIVETDKQEVDFYMKYKNYRMFHPSYCLLYIQMIYDYVMYTGDIEILDHVEETVQKIIKLFEGYLGENMLIEHAPNYMFMDWVEEGEYNRHHPPKCMGQGYLTVMFAGALDTYTIEAMMQDGKALQSGTSHFLGQNFGKAFDVQFINKENKLEYAWATSWGVSTRLMGALIMTHSDDNGLVLPPRLAPIQVVIIPIYKNAEQLQAIDEKVAGIAARLREMGISVKYDNADNKRPGFKFADYELKGVPVRLVLGARDLENNTVEVMRRDTLEKETRTLDGIEAYVKDVLADMQQNIYAKAKAFRDAHIYECDDYEEFRERVKDGGFFLCHWDGTPETEAKIKEDTQATIRCVPFEFEQTPGTDMVSGKPAKFRVLIARSY